jgi:hypothetical protein
MCSSLELSRMCSSACSSCFSAIAHYFSRTCSLIVKDIQLYLLIKPFIQHTHNLKITNQCTWYFLLHENLSPCLFPELFPTFLLSTSLTSQNQKSQRKLYLFSCPCSWSGWGGAGWATGLLGVAGLCWAKGLCCWAMGLCFSELGAEAGLLSSDGEPKQQMWSGWHLIRGRRWPEVGTLSLRWHRALVISVSVGLLDTRLNL